MVVRSLSRRLALASALSAAIVFAPLHTSFSAFNPTAPAFAQPGPPGAENSDGQAKAYGFYMKGLQLEKAGDSGGAIECYRKSISHFPRVKEVHHQLAKLLAKTGNTKQAHAEFQTALNQDYNYVECRNNFGTFLRSQGKDTEAEKAFKICIQSDPKFPFAYFNYALLLKDKGDLNGCIENLQTATRLKPDFAEAHAALGMAMYERASSGDLGTSLNQLLEAAKLLPNHPKIRYQLGIVYCTKAQLDQGEAEFRKCLMIDPQYAAAHYELGKLRYFRGDLDRALSELKAAEGINPAYTDEQKYPPVDLIKLKSLLAQVYEYMGEPERAIEVYGQLANMRGGQAAYAAKIKSLIKTVKAEKSRKKPLTYDPREVDELIARGIDQFEDGDLDGAYQSFDRGLQLNPSSFRCMQNISFIQEAAGEISSAVTTAQKAIALNPKYDGAHYNLAYLLEKMNLPADAATQYVKFREIAHVYPYDPQHIIELQQNMIRQERRQEYVRKRGY